jgi:hypothetical protein
MATAKVCVCVCVCVCVFSVTFAALVDVTNAWRSPEPFDPQAIKSQFNHVFAVVQLDRSRKGVTRYKCVQATTCLDRCRCAGDNQGSDGATGA